MDSVGIKSHQIIVTTARGVRMVVTDSLKREQIFIWTAFPAGMASIWLRLQVRCVTAWSIIITLLLLLFVAMFMFVALLGLVS